VFWDDDLKANVEPIQAMQGNLWDAGWDMKVSHATTDAVTNASLIHRFAVSATNTPTTRRDPTHA
jgi:hypothetical protein